MINPNRMYDCLKFWVKNHPDYKDIKIENEEDWKRKCPSFFDDIETSEQEFKDDASSSDDESENNKAPEVLDDNGNILEEPKDCDFNATTCLYPKEPAANVIVNHSNKIKKVKKKKKDDNFYSYAPGEEFSPTNWIREKNHDKIAFPEIFTNGKGGLNDEREVKLSRSDFYCQRFLNHDKRCAKNSDYLFVCQQHSERHLVENSISVSTQKGTLETGPDGTKIMQCKNAFDIFTKIPGTPSYWKQYRNEIFARMEQLGPFHFFFTLSCAEMKWSDVSTAILHSKGGIEKIVYLKDWEYDDNLILVVKTDGTEIPLPEYMKKEGNSKFYKDEFLLITRIFDNRVKAFISHILMANADVEHYSYRIGKSKF